jgi:hypothetical protein
LPGFYPDEYNINLANSARIVRRLYGRDHEIAIETFDPQAVFSHGLEMRATGNEDHLFACLRQAPAKIPADTAYSQDGNPHAELLLFTSGSRPLQPSILDRCSLRVTIQQVLGHYK